MCWACSVVLISAEWHNCCWPLTLTKRRLSPWARVTLTDGGNSAGGAHSLSCSMRVMSSSLCENVGEGRTVVGAGLGKRNCTILGWYSLLKGIIIIYQSARTKIKVMWVIKMFNLKNTCSYNSLAFQPSHYDQIPCCEILSITSFV